MYKHAIVKPPPKSFHNCISSHPLHHLVDVGVAKNQHDIYCKTLEELGLDLIRLPPDDSYPDSCFVEDAAIIFGRNAVITRMAKESRRGEVESISSVLSDYKDVRWINEPGTIEGGDVIHLNESLLCGLTQRTNQDGIDQTAEWLKTRISVIEGIDIVHLKSHVTFLNDNSVVMNSRFLGHPLLANFKQIRVPSDESYAANTLEINDMVIMSSRHPKSVKHVREAGFEVLTLDMSEFEKCEGALTCLSILF